MATGERAESAVAFLDEDEARGVVSAIAQIKSLATNRLSDGNRKIVFTSRGDFEVGVRLGQTRSGTFYCAAGPSTGSVATFDAGEDIPGMAEFAEILDDGIKLWTRNRCPVQIIVVHTEITFLLVYPTA